MRVGDVCVGFACYTLANDGSLHVLMYACGLRMVCVWSAYGLRMVCVVSAWCLRGLRGLRGLRALRACSLIALVTM